MSVPIVALYGALNAFLNVALAGIVSYQRRTRHVSLGSGTDKAVEIAVRAHGNNAEFVPLALVLLLIAELQGGSSLWLHLAGGTLLVARVLHAIGIRYRAPNFGRLVGIGLTWTVITATASWCLMLRS